MSEEESEKKAKELLEQLKGLLISDAEKVCRKMQRIIWEKLEEHNRDLTL